MQKQELDELKKKLPRGKNEIISKMLAGKYTPGTIKQMLNGNRKIQPAVLQEANRLIEIINPKTEENEND